MTHDCVSFFGCCLTRLAHGPGIIHLGCAAASTAPFSHRTAPPFLRHTVPCFHSTQRPVFATQCPICIAAVALEQVGVTAHTCVCVLASQFHNPVASRPGWGPPYETIWWLLLWLRQCESEISAEDGDLLSSPSLLYFRTFFPSSF